MIKSNEKKKTLKNTKSQTYWKRFFRAELKALGFRAAEWSYKGEENDDRK